jgi:hypothetical protein
MTAARRPLPVLSVLSQARFHLGIQLRMRRQRLVDQRNTDRIDRRRDTHANNPCILRDRIAASEPPETPAVLSCCETPL